MILVYNFYSPDGHLFFFLFSIHVCPPQGQSHHNGRWATELKFIQAFIPGTETLALLKSP